MMVRTFLKRATLCLPLLAVPLAPLIAQGELFGPSLEDASESKWDGRISFSGAHIKRKRDGVSDYNRSGMSANAEIGFETPIDDISSFRLEALARTDRYSTGYGGSAQLRSKLGKAVEVSVTGEGTRNAVVLEAPKADQAAVRIGATIREGNTRVEAFARHRWREYDTAPGVKDQAKGWQFSGRVHQRIGSYHWVEAGVSRDRMKDKTGRYGYRRNTLSADYSLPVARRIRLLLGSEYRRWTYDGRRVGDIATNAKRRDRLIRPEVGIAAGRTRGGYARATGGYDFYKSNDPRYTGNGPNLRLTVGYRF
jgi:hypothetical protein